VGLGDVTNWMNQTSGTFNYTGLVENMEMKAGSFYGITLPPDTHAQEAFLLTIGVHNFSGISCSLGLDLG
jgi:hypothetical protein